jgi:hypothetical protein
VHSHIAGITEESIPQGGYEDTGSTHLGQRARQDVTLGLDVHEFNGKPPDGGQLVCCLLRLGESQFARPCSDPYGHGATRSEG